MWFKQVLQAGVLVVFALVAAGCGAPIIAETTAGSVEQPVETTAAGPQESMIEGKEGPLQESPENTVASTTTATTTTTMPTLQYSPAWIEYQALELYDEDDSLENINERTMATFNYMSSNPNDISTPMGALCWVVHELTRSAMIVLIRVLLDDYHIPYLMEEYDVTSEQIGNPGPGATEAFLNLFAGDSEYTGKSDSRSDEDFWEYLRLEHEFAGDGTAWSDAVRAIASPEMAAAFRAGEGLPSDVQMYADALVAFAREHVGREFDISAESDDYYFGEPSLPGYNSFMAAAKYHQDCTRVMIDDSIGTLDSASASTTTDPTTASTIATGQPAVEETSPSTTVASTTTTTLLTLEYSPAWIEYQEVKSYVGDDSVESLRISNNYLSGNPNDNSTPMGALCWAFHELTRSYVMGTMRWILDDNWVPFLVEELGISDEQFDSPGPEATEAFLDLVSGEPRWLDLLDDGIGTGDQAGSTEGADVVDDGSFWDWLVLNHEFAGDGNAWSNAIRAVASPEMAAAFQAGEGLPLDVQVYADALVAFARERVGRKFDPSAESDDTDFDHRSFPSIDSFMAVAKYHQDCKRAGISDISSTIDSSSTSTTTIPPVASTTIATQDDSVTTNYDVAVG